MINAKLEDAIAVGPHLAYVRQASSKKRSNGEGNQGDAANSPSFRFPDVACPGHRQVVLHEFILLCVFLRTSANPYKIPVRFNENSPPRESLVSQCDERIDA